jgi:predicted dehydrogenase
MRGRRKEGCRARGITRRRFLRTTGVAALGAPWFVAASALGKAALPAASERITVGIIGVGGRGTTHLQGFVGESQVVAVADPQQARRLAAKGFVEKHYAEAMAGGPYRGCEAYRDFRDLLARGDIDAVSICTPDHWHAILAVAAAAAGKDVLCEKPLSVTVTEGRAVCEAIRRYGRVFQHGTQRRSERDFAFACELVRNGRIGRLHTVRVSSEPSHANPNDLPVPVPPGFDYDLWLGPAPWAPYSPRRCVTPWWYFIADYTIGFIAGQGVHFTDIAQWGLGADGTGPVEIEGRGDFAPDGLCDTATGWHVEMTFAGGVKLVYDDDRAFPMGVIFEGTDGQVRALCSGVSTEPQGLRATALRPGEVRLQRPLWHIADFINSVKTREPTAAPVEAAHRATSLCHLAHIAILTGRKLRWDPVSEHFLDDTEANRFLSRCPRSPWRL